MSYYIGSHCIANRHVWCNGGERSQSFMSDPISHTWGISTNQFYPTVLYHVKKNYIKPSHWYGEILRNISMLERLEHTTFSFQLMLFCITVNSYRRIGVFFLTRGVHLPQKRDGQVSLNVTSFWDYPRTTTYFITRARYRAYSSDRKIILEFKQKKSFH